MEFIWELKSRNETLFYFGLLNLVAAIIFILLSKLTNVEVAGVNAWYKPTKFALSTMILSWSIGWYTGHLPRGYDISIVNWSIVATLLFEVLYIAYQAGKGEMSHYNSSTPLHAFLFSIMALAATIATIAVAYIGLKFFTSPIDELPNYYLWAIRLGILLFVIFSFEGFVMGRNLAHTVGAPDGVRGIPFLNWSIDYGDLRIAHFVGMHALQILPLLAYFVLKDTKLTVASAILYGLLALFILTYSLRGNSIFQF